MKNPSTDTIAAIATPPGKGGVAIVRISGKQSQSIAKAIIGKCPPARHAILAKFQDHNLTCIDSGLALFFKGPHSFTGEDVLELHGHGGPVVSDMLLSRVLQLGARLARPGEFSERAFLNDKIDLAEAEAIADLIDSQSKQAARLAMRSLQGEFSRHIHSLVDKIIQLRIYVEAAIDFPEEEIDFLSDGRVETQVRDILTILNSTLESATQGRLLREGMNVVITGRPNVGKSTLLNQLCERETSIVTDLPGTTRDVIREFIQIDGLPVHIIDTAGLRTAQDAVEKEGIRRAWSEIEQADLILLIVDAVEGIQPQDRDIQRQLPKKSKTILVLNKMDKTGQPVQLRAGPEGDEIHISAKHGLGIDLIRDYLKKTIGYHGSNEGSFLARRRHIDALLRTKKCVVEGLNQLVINHAGELLAEELSQAQKELGQITGEFNSDDLLGKIFSSFCIGK